MHRARGKGRRGQGAAWVASRMHWHSKPGRAKVLRRQRGLCTAQSTCKIKQPGAHIVPHQPLSVRCPPEILVTGPSAKQKGPGLDEERREQAWLTPAQIRERRARFTHPRAIGTTHATNLQGASQLPHKPNQPVPGSTEHFSLDPMGPSPRDRPRGSCSVHPAPVSD